MDILLQLLILGAFIAGVVGLYKFLVSRAGGNPWYVWGVRVTLIGAFLLFWVNGAVGIIGHADNDANMLYGVVFLVGALIAGITRFRAMGMVAALGGMAVAQVLVPAISVAAQVDLTTHWSADMVWLTAFWCAIWAGVGFAVSARWVVGASGRRLTRLAWAGDPGRCVGGGVHRPSQKIAADVRPKAGAAGCGAGVLLV